jgi:hypothetical protein
LIPDWGDFFQDRGDVEHCFVSPGENTGRAGEHSYERGNSVKETLSKMEEALSEKEEE